MNVPTPCPRCQGASIVLRFRPGIKFHRATMQCTKCGHVWGTKEQKGETK